MPDQDLLDYIKNGPTGLPAPVVNPWRKPGGGFGTTRIQDDLLKTSPDSQYETLNQYTDPFGSAGAIRDPEGRFGEIENAAAHMQTSMDKLGNGMVKMAGSFANGLLSSAGTLYGLPASVLAGMDNMINGKDNPSFSQLWDNPFSNAGNDISNAVSKNFMNYQTKEEKHANAWSPQYWMTMNFLSDGILSNLGYAAAAWVTGLGASKFLSKIAPLIASGKINNVLEAVKAGEEIEMAVNAAKTGNALHSWDAFQQVVSNGLASAGEASTEAKQNYDDTKQTLTEAAIKKYGSAGNVPNSVTESIEADSRKAGDLTYSLNIPILAGANMIQWGRSLTPFSSELSAAEKNPLRIKNIGKEFLGGVEAVPKEGVKGFWASTVPKIGHFFKENIAEAGQEAMQFQISETEKNWYQRKHDPEGYKAANGLLSPFDAATKTLFTTQEGVANILGGFAGGGPFQALNAVADLKNNKEEQKVSQETLNYLNNPLVRENTRTYLDNIARHVSAEASLQHAIASGDEHLGRNAKEHMLYSWFNSRLQTGRADLLNDEIAQLEALSDEGLKQWLNLPEDTKINKDELLKDIRVKADDMYKTYKNIDRVFSPDNYRIKSLDPKEAEDKLKELHEYKQMMWGYMMDYKNRSRRAAVLSKEVTSAFNDLLPFSDMTEDKFGDNEELNNLHREYIAAVTDHKLNERYDPAYSKSDGATKVKELQRRIKAKMIELSTDKKVKFASIEDYMGEGKKDYIERYLFSIDKQFEQIMLNPTVASSIAGIDYHKLIEKAWDLADLHRDRQLAIHSYNQLASMIKSGTYLGRKMTNPDYDEDKHKDIPEEVDGEPNPDYVPKFIDSNEMLSYEGYKQAKSERTTFHEELKAKVGSDKLAQDEFNKKLETFVADDQSEDSLAYRQRVSQYTNGSKETGKSLVSMNDEQFTKRALAAYKRRDFHDLNGTFATHTKKLRDEFPYDTFIDNNALLKAIEDEKNRRVLLYNDQVKEAAKSIVKVYNTSQAPGSQPVQYVSGETKSQIKPEDIVVGMMIGATPLEERHQPAIDLAKKMIVENEAQVAETTETTNKASIASLTQGQIPANGEGIITDVIWKDAQPYPNDPSRSFITYEDYMDTKDRILAKYVAGQPLTSREQDTFDYKPYNKWFLAMAGKAKENVLEAKAKSPQSMEQPEPLTIALTNVDENITQSLKETRFETIRADRRLQAFTYIRFQRSDIWYNDGTGENMYENNGDVIRKQLSKDSFGLFTNPVNPLNFSRDPTMRFVYTGKKMENGIDPLIDIEVSPDNGVNWQKTGYTMQGKYDQNKELIKPNFSGANRAAIATKQQEFEKLIDDLQDSVIKGGANGLRMMVNGPVGVGHVVENRIDPATGKREKRGLLEVSGNNLNDPANPYSPLLAVIMDRQPGDSRVGVKLTPGSKEITDINTLNGVHVDQTLLNLVAEPGESKQTRAGQYVMLVPMGKLTGDGTKQMYFPVLLAGKLLKDFQSQAYGTIINDTSTANMGEILIDALLNPWRPEHTDLMGQLFDMSGMQGKYKGNENTDAQAWRDFYEDNNIHRIVNQLFFSSGTTLDNGRNYKLPFKIETSIRTKKPGDKDDTTYGIKVKIIMNEAVLKQQLSTEIYITQKDGRLRVPMKDKYAGNYIQYRMDEVDKNATLKYSEIQRTLRNKAFHVQIGLMSQKSKGAPGYNGFVLDEKTGKLSVKAYDSYFHYVDALGLAGTTIQSITNPANSDERQWMVNQNVYFKQAPVSLEDIPTVQDKTNAPFDIDPASVTLVPGAVTTGSTKTTRKARVAKTAKTAKVEEPIVPDVPVVPASISNRKQGGPKKGGKSKGMVDLSKVKSISQYEMKFAGTPGRQYSQQLTDQLTAIMLKAVVEHKGKGFINGTELKEYVLQVLQDRQYALMQKARPVLKKLTYEVWDAIVDPNDPAYDYLDDKEVAAMDPDDRKQYQAMQVALTYDDIDRFIELDKDGTLDDYGIRDDITTSRVKVPGTDKYESVFFEGYLNRALSQVTQIGIVQLYNVGDEQVLINDDDASATRRYSDNWALRVSPKSTLGMPAKVLLYTIPSIQISIDKKGKVTESKKTSLVGTVPYVDYQEAFNQMTIIGMASDNSNFERNLMTSTDTELSPAIFSLRRKLEETRDRDRGTYDQLIRQLAQTFLNLRENNVYVVRAIQGGDKNASIDFFPNATIKIGDQIAAKWQQQFLQVAKDNNYAVIDTKVDKRLRTSLEHYTLDKGVKVTKNGETVEFIDFAEAFKRETEAILAGKNLEFDDYVALAHSVKNWLGIELVAGDFRDPDSAGYRTAKVLEELKTNKKLLGYLIKRKEIGRFEDIFKTLLYRDVAHQIRKNLAAGVYDPETPFKNSSKALDTLAKIFKSYHPSMINSQANNADGESEQTLVLGNMLNDVMKNFQNEEEMKFFKSTPLGKYNYFLNQMLVPDNIHPEITRFEPVTWWKDMKADLASGFDVSESGKNQRDKQSLKDASGIDKHIASMQMFQNKETAHVTPEETNRGMAWYYMPFGDSTANSVIRSAKFAFVFDYNEGKLHIKDTNTVDNVRHILYTQFKSEINAVSEGLKKFNTVNNNPDLTSLADKKALLTKDFDYVQVGDFLRPGARAHSYYYGEDFYTITEDHPLYITGSDDNGLTHYPVSLRPKLYNTATGELDDQELTKVFDNVIDDYLSKQVQMKMDIVMPYIDSFFKLGTPEEVEGGFRSPSFYTRLTDTNYIKSVEEMFYKTSTIDGKELGTYIYDETLYKTEKEAMANGMHMQLLKAMIIDQQVNHHLFATNFYQMTWDFAQFDNKNHDWKSFVDIMIKRHKGYNTPRPGTFGDTHVQYIVYNDMKYGGRVLSLAKEAARIDNRTGMSRVGLHELALIDFMKANGLGEYVEGDKLPGHYKELSALYKRHSDAGRSTKVITTMLKNKLKGEITDGSTYITLREHLFQEVMQGSIKAEDYFRLLDKYSDPDREFTNKDRRILRLPAKKMVYTGMVRGEDRYIATYVKDGQTILLPAQVKNGIFEQVLRDLHTLESAYANDHPRIGVPTPGFHLSALSTQKEGNAVPIDLFDANGDINPFIDPEEVSDEIIEKYHAHDWDAERKYDEDGDPIYPKEETDYLEAVDRGMKNSSSTAILNAKVSVVPRSGYGMQQQKPENKKDEITGGSQIQELLTLAADPSVRYAKDSFGAPVLTKPGAKVRLDDDNQPVVIADGMTAIEMMDSMLTLSRGMHEINLRGYADRYGLNYQISDAWLEAMTKGKHESEDAFQKHVDALRSPSNTKENRKLGEHLDYIKHTLELNSIDKMTQAIKEIAYTKGMEPSQFAIFNEKIEGPDGQQHQKMSLSFAPGSTAYQEIVISQIQKLVKGIKRHGTSGATSSSVVLDTEPGVPFLKGYEIIYDKNGHDIGMSVPETQVPWNIRDSAGRLLKYQDYLTDDGYVKKHPGTGESMISDELLYVIAYRIPNTGTNMSAVHKIKKFSNPLYDSTIYMPDNIYAQMNSDNDDDQIYHYTYNFAIDPVTKVLTKVKGVLDLRQKNALDILDNEDSVDNVIHNILIGENPNYERETRNTEAAYKKLMEQLDELKTEDDLAEENDSYTPGLAKFRGVSLEQLKDRIIQGDSDSNVPTDIDKDLKAKAKKLAKLQKALLKKYDGIVSAYKNIKIQIDARKKGFDLKAYLADRPDNYVKAQSYEQLENAWIDVYQHILRDDATFVAMTTPLTTDNALSEIITKHYDDESIRDHKEKGVSPNAEISQTNVGVNNSTRSTMVSILAAAGPTAKLMEDLNISLGTKSVEIAKRGAVGKTSAIAKAIRPIAFLDDDTGTFVMETGNEPGRFTRVQKNGLNQKTYNATEMTLTLSSGESFKIPNRLDRIFDNKGVTRVHDHLQSLLQAFLDAQTTPEIVYSGVNPSTFNAAFIMNRLGYTEMLEPFMLQEILEDYSQMSEDSPIIIKEGPVELITDYLNKAGIGTGLFLQEIEISKKASLSGRPDVPASLYKALKFSQRGEEEVDYERYFGLKEMRDMITERYKREDGKLEESDTDKENYYAKQLFVLDMFYRMDEIGQQMFDTAQRVKLKSKGYADMSPMGLEDANDKYDELQDAMGYDGMGGGAIGANLIGSERAGPWNDERNPHARQTTSSVAFQFSKKAGKWLFGKQKLFSEHTPYFEIVRWHIGQLTGRQSLKQRKRTNLHIVQYTLSNPDLYAQLIPEGIPEEDRHSAHALRKHVYTDAVVEVVDEVKKTGYYKVVEEGLANRINNMGKTINTRDPQKATYAQTYPVLDQFKTKVKPNGDISWVYDFNTNNYRERGTQNNVNDVYNMLHDPNPDIQTVAKYLFLYFYLGGGTTSPHSFGQMLPQEMLFKHEGFADILYKIQEDLSHKMDALNREVYDQRLKKYNKPKWFKVFDKTYIKTNKEASKRMLAIYTQIIQNSPFDATINGSRGTKKYKDGVHFDAVEGSNIVTLTGGKIKKNNKVEHPASFLDELNNVYIINPDYKTYTRYNRTGTPMLAEFDYALPSSDTMIANNKEKFAEPQVLDAKTVKFDQEMKEMAASQEAFKIDEPASALGMMNYYFNTDSERITPSDITDPKRIQELAEMRVLALAILPNVPKALTVTPFSLKAANKQSGRTDGMLALEDGSPAFGMYTSIKDYDNNLATGKISLAYEYMEGRKQEPLLVRQALIHETFHAAFEHAKIAAKKMASGELDEEYVKDMLNYPNGYAHDSYGNTQGAVDQMIQGYKNFKAVYDAVNQNGRLNPRLKERYLKYVAESKTGTPQEALNRLSNILVDEDEFAARLFDDKQFRDAMRDVDYKKGNLLTAILEAIRDLLGLREGSALYEAMNSVFEIMEPIIDTSLPSKGFTMTNMDNIYSRRTNTPAASPVLGKPGKTFAGVTDHKMYYRMSAANNLTGKDTSTLELIIAGLRTATTRSYALGKVGDIITFEKQPQRYEITGVEELTEANTHDPKWIKQWSKKEQWTTKYFKSVLGKENTVKVGSFQTSFKKVSSTQDTVRPMLDMSSAKSVLAVEKLRVLYKGVSNFDTENTTPEEMQLYDQLVKEGKIIC